VHHNGKLACYGDGRALETDPFPEFQTPRPQRTLGRYAGQNHRGCFVEEIAEVTIATSRNVAIIVDLSRLIPPGRQATDEKLAGLPRTGYDPNGSVDLRRNAFQDSGWSESRAP
jgi:hypothetical protein